jgi:drug/metabolite transporter (DMT)-like permease
VPAPVNDTAPVDDSRPDREQRTAVLAALALVWAAAMFGISFVVVKGALDEMRPVPYLSMRFLLAGIVFGAVALRRPASPGELRMGVLAGASYTAGMVCQTTGLQYTTAAASAFLTYLLVVAVPVIGYAMTRIPPKRPQVFAIAIAVTGLALLTGGGVGFGRGEVLTLVGAACFGLHIIQVGQAAGRVDSFRFNAIQVLVVACVLLPFVPFTGGLPTGADSWAVIVYTALVVTVGTFLPWTWAQRTIPPTRAALILLTEPVFAAIAAYVRGERYTAVEVLGAGLILAAAVLSELAPRIGRPQLDPAVRERDRAG